MVPSTVDPDATGLGDKMNKGPKKGVRISAWKLAKLDSNEAMKAAAKARASSSVLRPVDGRRLPDSEISSSENASVRSSMSTETGGNKDTRNEYRLSPLRNSFAPSQGSRDEYETGTQSVSSFSSPRHVHESVSLSPLPGLNPNPVAAAPIRNNAVFHKSSGFDEKIMQRHSGTEALPLSGQATSFIRDVKRTSVVWDQEAGRYVSVAVARKRAPNVNVNEDKGPVKEGVGENVTYSGESIFFGGPLLRAGDGQDRVVPRYKRDALSNQLPIFIPGDFELNPPASHN